jgi:phosphoglucomutase
MPISPLAGKPAPSELLIDVDRLQREYFEHQPDVDDANQRVAFGTSGHRGTPAAGTFNEAHILAITQAICDYRQTQKITGPLFMGMDTHALSASAQRTALEVLAGNHTETIIQKDNGATPTPSISRAVLVFNQNKHTGLADGIVITPSHNPPEDGGFKYNATDGGPADTSVTGWIEERANELLKARNTGVRRVSFASALTASTTHEEDLLMPYVGDLKNVIDVEAIRSSGLKIGVDPLGGASAAYWEPMAELFELDITVVNKSIDPTFSFMSVDHDGKIRMDCSSPYAMAGLVRLKDQFDIAWATDPDADRHGIVTRSGGLMNPNHYLAVAIHYLLQHRPDWPAQAAVGKTLVSSSLIDQVVDDLGRKLWEVPVGFKWFSPGLFDGTCCFGGEESAGASFLRRNGSVWTTDKDGLLLGLLSAEITARTGKDPAEHYRSLSERFGTSYYTRIDAPATPAQKSRLKALAPTAVTASDLAGDPITGKFTEAPGNHAPIGGLKVTTQYGWFAARPSGTENIFKLYAESFRSEEHLSRLLAESQQIVTNSLA